MSEEQLPIFYMDREMFSMHLNDKEKRLKPKNHSGVYVIFSFKHGFVYVGKATDIYRRVMYHLSRETDRTITKLLFRNKEGEAISEYTFPKLSKTLIDKIKVDEHFSLNDFYSSHLIVFPIGDSSERKKVEKKLIIEKHPRYNIMYNESNVPKFFDKEERIRIVEMPTDEEMQIVVREKPLLDDAESEKWCSYACHETPSEEEMLSIPKTNPIFE